MLDSDVAVLALVTADIGTRAIMAGTQLRAFDRDS